MRQLIKNYNCVAAQFNISNYQSIYACPWADTYQLSKLKIGPEETRVIRLEVVYCHTTNFSKSVVSSNHCIFS